MRHGFRAAMARRFVFASPCNQCMRFLCLLEGFGKLVYLGC